MFRFEIESDLRRSTESRTSQQVSVELIELIADEAEIFSNGDHVLKSIA